jgi:hypothetical protein
MAEVIMSNRTDLLVIVLLIGGLAIGTVASVRAGLTRGEAARVSEVGPMPGPFNPNLPVEDHGPAQAPSHHG